MESTFPSDVPTDDWLQTNHGRAFDFQNPKPEQIDIDDIATALARIPRFGAKMKLTEYTYSVAQHSVLVSYLVALEFALAGLLHDATEGLLGFDMPTPVKAVLPEFKAKIEEPIDRAVFARFGIPWGHMAEVKKADLDALMIERHLLMDKPPRPWTIEFPKGFDVDGWCETWADLVEPVLPWQTARSVFLSRFRKLYRPRYARPNLAGIGGWTWDEEKGDFWRAGPLGEGTEWMRWREKNPHVPMVEIGVGQRSTDSTGEDSVMTNEEKAREIAHDAMRFCGCQSTEGRHSYACTSLTTNIAAALTEARRERDRLWCRALIETLPTTDSEKVLAWFNANRPDQDAAALLPQQGGDRV